MIKLNSKEVKQWVKHHQDEWMRMSKRFEEMDGSLTDEEVAKLYAGYIYTDDYDSFGEDWLQVYALIKADKIGEAMDMAWQTHCKNPYNLDVLNFMVRTVPQTHELWTIMAWHFAKLLRAILKTGDGKSKEEAIYVTSVSDEYIVMRSALEITDIKNQRIWIDGEHVYDVFIVSPSAQYYADEVWFEITASNNLATQYINSLRSGR